MFYTFLKDQMKAWLSQTEGASKTRMKYTFVESFEFGKLFFILCMEVLYYASSQNSTVLAIKDVNFVYSFEMENLKVLKSLSALNQ